MELISIKTVFRFELTQDYGLRYPLGLFRMVIRINPKGYYLHIYLHRFAVVLSSIQIAAANGWWLLQQRRRAASTLTCLHLHLRLHLRLRLHKKNQHNQSTASRDGHAVCASLQALARIPRATAAALTAVVASIVATTRAHAKVPVQASANSAPARAPAPALGWVPVSNL